MTTWVESVKVAAHGRWVEILTAAGLPAGCLTGRNGPCPKCVGKDRFAAFKDVAETGGVNCRKCHCKGNGDGIATLQWWRDCSFQEAVAFAAERLGLSPSQVKSNGKPRIVATYDYRDEAGNVLFQVVRFDPKDFRQRRPDGKGGWKWNVKGVQVVPYRLRELLADTTRPVFVVEGEKDVDNLACIGVLATCNAGGAGKWTAEHSAFLRGRTVFIIPDNEGPGKPGEPHAQSVAASLQGIAASARIVRLPTGKDASDWIEAQPDAREAHVLA